MHNKPVLAKFVASVFVLTTRLALVQSTSDDKLGYSSEVLSQAGLVYEGSCEPSIAGFNVPLLEEQD